jgi:phenylalanyl-tRNA synthetase beta chain
MRVSFNWLNEMVETGLSPEELAEKLTMAGLEVEKIEHPGERLNNVVVGKVLSVERHPNADKLTVCRVDSGPGELQIICGAPNVRAGAKIALGLVGAVLSDGTTLQKLRKTRIRGVDSQGMICSERELGLGSDAAGIIILPDEYEVGQSLASALGLDDAILVIDVTPNRPDCLSVLGVAREAAAILRREVKPLPSGIVESDDPSSMYASVVTGDFDLCPRYCARVLTGVTVGPSPPWLRQRIELCGVRAINNVVDVTNYVMLEMGQPLHAFDLEKLREHRIVVRTAVRGETILTLDGQDRRLHPDMLVIADAHRPVAIAGVMGGANTEVDQETTSLLLESAYFTPSSVRRTSRELGLSTEASYRFERGADPEAQAFAATRAAELIRSIAGGEVKRGVIETAGKIPLSPEVPVRNRRVNLVLGTSLPEAEIESIYRRLGIEILRKEKDAVVLRPPSFRRDLVEEIDFVEEVARLFGYDRLPQPATRATVGTTRRDPWQTFEELTKNVLTGFGFFEIISSDLISERRCRQIVDMLFETPVEALRVLNPVSEERNVLRPSLIPGLLESVARNQAQKRETIRLFEIGRTRHRAGKGEAVERASLCLGMTGCSQESAWDSSPREADFYDMKGVVESYLSRLGIKQVTFGPARKELFHPGRIASVSANGKEIGCFGELSGTAYEAFDLRPRVIVCEVDAQLLAASVDFSLTFRKLPVFPGSSRDIAIIVDEGTTYEDVLAALRKKTPGILEGIELFDVYRSEQMGAGKKSMAFSLKYRSKVGTLTDEEVEAAHSAIKSALVRTLACEIRERKEG